MRLPGKGGIYTVGSNNDFCAVVLRWEYGILQSDGIGDMQAVIRFVSNAAPPLFRQWQVFEASQVSIEKRS